MKCDKNLSYSALRAYNRRSAGKQGRKTDSASNANAFRHRKDVLRANGVVIVGIVEDVDAK